MKQFLILLALLACFSIAHARTRWEYAVLFVRTPISGFGSLERYTYRDSERAAGPTLGEVVKELGGTLTTFSVYDALKPIGEQGFELVSHTRNLVTLEGSDYAEEFWYFKRPVTD